MPKKKTIRKRANKSGTIVKLKGNRRKPFAVRVTTGRDQETGTLLRKDLEYFETEIEASDFLDMYNLMKKKNDRITVTDEQAKMIDNNLFEKVKSVTNQEKHMLTFEEIFNLLIEEKYKYQGNIKSIRSWFNNFLSLHNRLINTITLFDLQGVIDEFKKKGRKVGTLAHMKCVAFDIFEYAVIHQYIKRDQDFSSYIDVSTNVDKSKPKRHPFSIDEIHKLINKNDDMAKFALLYIFSGCRPGELLTIDTSKIFLDVLSNDDGSNAKISYMITGSKTEAGIDRVIPIHNYIKPIIVDLLDKHNDYLIYPQNPNTDFTQTFYLDFCKYMATIEMNHIPYECRHSFITFAKEAKMDSFSIKRIVGHKSNDITDDIYTHTIINRLFNEIQKIKV